MKTLIATAAALGLAAAVAVAAPAAADPKGQLIPLSCDNGSDYVIAVNGNGDFTPGHDVDSTSVLVPTAFGEFHAVVTDESGAVIDEFSEPGIAKGRSTKDRRTSTTCSFAFSDQFMDPDLGLLTFTVSGTVSGFITPVR